jgi:hypothetical protein
VVARYPNLTAEVAEFAAEIAEESSTLRSSANASASSAFRKRFLITLAAVDTTVTLCLLH